MKINFFHITLISLYFISASFLGLLSLPLRIDDVVLIVSLLIIITYMHHFNKIVLYEDRYFFYFLLYGFFASIIMAYLNFSQPILFSVKAARIFITYIILIIALNILLKNFQIKKLYSFSIFITFLIVSISFYVYITGDISVLVEDVGIFKRLGEIRITIATATSIFLVLFFYYQVKNNIWFILPLLGLLSTLIIVGKTRTIIFPLLLMMLIPLLRVYKAQVLKVWIGFIFIILISFVVLGYEKSILTPIINLFTLLVDETQSIKSSNVNIRGLELVYFWNFLDIKSIIFGFGMENILFKELYDSHFYLSDIGLFKIFYLHGIIGSLLYILMYWRLYTVSKKSNTALHLTGRSIVYFQILSPSNIFLYTPEFMFLFFSTYILIKNYNKKITKEY